MIDSDTDQALPEDISTLEAAAREALDELNAKRPTSLTLKSVEPINHPNYENLYRLRSLGLRRYRYVVG